jgi:hypothetical protein
MRHRCERIDARYVPAAQHIALEEFRYTQRPLKSLTGEISGRWIDIAGSLKGNVLAHYENQVDVAGAKSRILRRRRSAASSKQRQAKRDRHCPDNGSLEHRFPLSSRSLARKAAHREDG